MRPQYEKVPAQNAFYVYSRVEPRFPFNWHYHPEYELTLIVDSYGQRLVGDGIADYASGDLVLVGPNLPHSWRSAENANLAHRAVVVQFRREFLGARFFDLPDLQPVARLLERSENGLSFVGTLGGAWAGEQLASMPAMSPCQKLITLLAVLGRLAVEEKAQPLSSSQRRPSYPIEHQHRVDNVCAYLEANYKDEIDHSALVKLAHMDQASLCRFFKRATGRTLTAYVNELRIASAARLLMETDLSVLEVGCRVGFGNHSNFNRQFKRLRHASPGTVRKRFQQQMRSSDEAAGEKAEDE